MNSVALVFLVCLAGFLIYPVIIGFYAWNRARPNWLWVSMALWSLVSAALLAVTAALLWSETPARARGPLLSVRHVLIGLGLILVMVVMDQLSGRIPRVITGLIIGIVVVRALLWFTTDLFWVHRVNADGTGVYGPMRGPTSVLLSVLIVLAAIYAISQRPWRSELARRGLLYALVPGVILSVVVVYPGVVGEYLLAVVLVPSLVALQVMYFADFRRRHQRTRMLAEREARLASFGADVLSNASEVPELAAVTLVSDMLEAPSRYVPGASGDGQVIASPRRPGQHAASLSPGSEEVTEISVPVEVAGEVAGVLHSSVPGATEDDEAFVRAVGAVLSAALSRSHADRLLREKSLRDPLTGLPSWALLMDRLRRLLAQPQNLPVGVLCCDIKGLKDINDEFGHEAGDEVLRRVAGHIKQVVSPQTTVGRLGADEFVIVSPVLTAPQAEWLATRVGQAVAQPIQVPGNTVTPGIRVGFTIAESPVVSVDRLVRDAEMAVMLAKRENVETVAYSEPLRAQLVGHKQAVRDLAEAIEQRLITVAYQPIVHLATLSITGVEALARWHRPDGTQVEPIRFIRLAEEVGLMRDLGALVFEQAIGQLATWTNEHEEMRDLRLSLNLSPEQLADPRLADELAAMLSRFDVAPTRITLEVTESGLQQATEKTAHHLARFRDMGVGLSLDDFGTGYSTLTRLMAFPVTELKIDRQFTSELQGSASAIVPAVVGLAHASGLTVVAEGIETLGQRDLVTLAGCDYGQGYLFDRPLPPDELPGRASAAPAATARA